MYTSYFSGIHLVSLFFMFFLIYHLPDLLYLYLLITSVIYSLCGVQHITIHDFIDNFIVKLGTRNLYITNYPIIDDTIIDVTNWLFSNLLR